MTTTMSATCQRQAMMTTREAACVLNVSANTLRRWHDRGVIKACRIGSRGDRRFLRKDVERLIHQLHKNGGDERRPVGAA
ncbi:MAG: binding protein, excisionase family [Dehalococcoidia bacterium]|nr:binding protein, excisionase family [Dehalococcoidia bacterium]